MCEVEYSKTLKLHISSLADEKIKIEREVLHILYFYIGGSQSYRPVMLAKISSCESQMTSIYALFRLAVQHFFNEK